MQQLLDQMLDSQSEPEEVCRSCPESLAVVRELRWRASLCRLRAELDTLFPNPHERAATAIMRRPKGKTLPEIPGYEVETLLGHGGMGVVFRARHLRLNRIVALKMALAGAYAGPRERERFQREAEAVAALRHPNVVQIHDIGDSDGRPYFTMEYLEGGTLAQKLAGKPQPARQAAALLAILARAVHTAHQGGIVHRDLKPSNVFLTADGTPKIGDFGLARRFDTCVRPHPDRSVAAGTPSYMAPEQARGRGSDVGPSADVYALGAILYEMLTGRPPFEADTAAQTVQQLISEDLQPLPSRLEPESAARPGDHLPEVLAEEALISRLRDWRAPWRTTSKPLPGAAKRSRRGRSAGGKPPGPPDPPQPDRDSADRDGIGAPGPDRSCRHAGMGPGRRTARRDPEVGGPARPCHSRMQREGRFPEARGGARKGSPTPAPDDSCAPGSSGLQAELDLAERLDGIRLGRASQLAEKLAFKHSAEAYEAALRDAGLGSPQDAPEDVAGRIQSSNVPSAILASGWMTGRPCAEIPAAKRLGAGSGPPGRPRSDRLAAARPRSGDLGLQPAAPGSGRVGPGRRRVGALAAGRARRTPSATSVGARDAIPFPQTSPAGTSWRPGDFWANLRLAEALMENNELPDARSVLLYQAAVALRLDGGRRL